MFVKRPYNNQIKFLSDKPPSPSTYCDCTLGDTHTNKKPKESLGEEILSVTLYGETITKHNKENCGLILSVGKIKTVKEFRKGRHCLVVPEYTALVYGNKEKSQVRIDRLTLSIPLCVHINKVKETEIDTKCFPLFLLPGHTLTLQWLDDQIALYWP